jgi:sugar-specific transcriptional regulator TrmB
MEYGVLKRIGLTGNETKVYLALLKLGESLASSVSKETNINRSLIYRILEDLINKGFVSYVIKENRKYFSSANPHKLLDILKEKEEEIKKIIPTLINLKKSEERNIPKVEVYSGKEGMKSILEKALFEKEILVLGARRDFAEKLEFYHPNWHKRREKLKISLKALFQKEQDILRNLGKINHTKVRYLSESIKSEVMFSIFGNNLAVELWSDFPMTILIRDDRISEGFKHYFNLLWKLAKK